MTVEVVFTRSKRTAVLSAFVKQGQQRATSNLLKKRSLTDLENAQREVKAILESAGYEVSAFIVENAPEPSQTAL